MQMCLSEFLHGLDFLGARKSSEYVGTKVDNPAMILEEHVASWTRLTSLEDLQECFRVYEERVCVPDFPARYSPQFWLAHAALTTIYSVLSAYLETHIDDDLRKETNILLFDLWIHLLTSGPGSTHLEMMDIILKYPHYPLWRYMQTLHGEDLQSLVLALKTDFVYKEDVPADHYATLMETHIDKIFKFILSSAQIEEARRELLDLYAFYLIRMNHVPPHIGPRFSHLCFLICQRYELENPYMGRDDWVLMRNHLKVIKDIVTDPSFTTASEAQYRAPLTLEKIFQAVVQDNMLDIMFKDFMSLLLTICNHGNSKKCKRLFIAYKTALFEEIDFKKGFETTPIWMFDQCIQMLGKLSKTVNMETHIDEFIVSAQNLCLLKFTQLNAGQVSGWHELMVNYLVSGRTLLVREAVKLLNSSVLKENNVLNWKTHGDQGRLLIDIITDVPGAFIQADQEGNMTKTVQEYVTFLHKLLSQMSDQGIEGRVRQNVHKCLLKCMEKDPPLKSPISLTCIESAIPDLTDVNFIKDVLFSIETLLKDERCPGDDVTLTEVVMYLLQACLQFYKSKGYIPVDVNSLLMSVCLACMSAEATSQLDTGQVTEPCDMWMTLYESAVVGFVELHMEKGTIRSVASLVPQVILAIQDSLQRSGTTLVRCVNFLSVLETKCFQLISDQMTKLLELFLDWKCYEFSDLLVTAYTVESGPFLAVFQDLFSKTLAIEHDKRHYGMIIVEQMSNDHSELFTLSHTCHLLGTYPTETDITQYHILNTILNIVKKSPGHVATYISVLIDDTKFPADSLNQKAPILQCLTQYSEELSQKVVDYLMKHVDNKEDSVSLVAMETLVPLIKNKPGYILKQKVRFKNVWKSSNNERVKQLCVQLLPDLKTNVKKPAQKVPQNTSQTLVLKETKKLVPTINRNTRYRGQVQSRPMTSDRITKTAASMPLKSEHSSSLITKTNVTDGDKELSAKLKTEPGEDKTIGSPVKAEGFFGRNVIGHSLRPIEDATNGAGDKVLHVAGELEDEDRKMTGDFYKSSSVTPVDLYRTDVEIVNHKHEHNLETSGNHMTEKVDGNQIISQNLLKVDKPSTDIIRSKKDPSPSELIESDKKTEYSTEERKLKTAAVTEREEKTVNQHFEPSVCLCSCIKVKHLIERFGVKLRQAGYDNTIKSAFEGNTGNMFTGARVIIVCLDGFKESSDDKLMDEISRTAHKDIPLIALKFQNVPWSKTVQTKGRHIRLYSKPNEEKISGTDWPKYKFCEVLMQLNYLGITLDKHLITDEFRSLWEMKHHLSNEVMITDGSIPDIFISYHWGKLNKVEPLYECLTREQFCCWFGAYQMKGTESLYNKIQQGLQCCRVVLACVTNNYHLSEICRRDINTAKQLDRIIIPLLIGDCIWPLSDKFGHMLDKCKPLRLGVTHEGCIDVKSAGMSNLVTQLKRLLENVDERELERSSETDKWEENVNQRMNAETVKHSNEVTESERTFKKTSTMYEFESHSLSEDGITRRYSNIEGFKINKRDLPDGVIVDEHGYTLKSSRSKSCLIL